MLPSLMTDVAVAVRISGRRMRSQGTNPAPLPPRRTASPRRTINTIISEVPSLDYLFISALVRAGLCREHACAFRCRPGKVQKTDFQIRGRISRHYSHLATQVREYGEDGNELGTEISPAGDIGAFEGHAPRAQSEENTSGSTAAEDVDENLTSVASDPTIPTSSPSDEPIQHAIPVIPEPRPVPAITIRQKIIRHDGPLPNIVKGRHVFYPPPGSQETTSIQVRNAPFRDSNAPTDWESNSKVNQKPKSTATSFRGLRSSLLKIVPRAKRNPITALNPPIRYSSTLDPSEPPPELPRIHRYMERIGPKRVIPPQYQSALQNFVNQPPQKDGNESGLRQFKPFHKREPPLNTVNKQMFGRRPSSQEEHTAIESFRKTLWSYKYDNKDLFDLYLALPGKRIEYLDRKTMDRTIAAFMSVPLRDETAMLRYMTVVEDMHASGIPLTRPEWNQAMSMVAFAYRHVTKVEVDTVLDMWTNMEENYGIIANIDTFNILLDISSKARNHDLFHKLLGEIRARKLEWDRFTHTIVISHCGIMGDAAEVSRAYKNMVDAGEIIDVTVLNAVMTAMLACNEFSAAERVYEHMRQLTLYDPETPPETPSSPLLGWIMRHRPARDYEIARDQAQKLRLMARLVEYSNITKASLKPDLITYHIFILYFCKLGNWDGLRHIVTHMNDAQIPANATTYEALFRGFSIHGRDDGPVWRAEHLKRLLDEVLYREDDQIKWLGALVRKLITAVANVTRDREITQHYWTEAVKAWQRQGGRIDHMTMAMYNQIMHDFDVKQGTRTPSDVREESKALVPETARAAPRKPSPALKSREQIEKERWEAKEKKLREKEWKVRMLMEKGRIEAEKREREAWEAAERLRIQEEARARREKEERDREALLLAEKKLRERREQERKEREAREQMEKEKREQKRRERQAREVREREQVQRLAERAEKEQLERDRLEKDREEIKMMNFWDQEIRDREVQHAQMEEEEGFLEEQLPEQHTIQPPSAKPLPAQPPSMQPPSVERPPNQPSLDQPASLEPPLIQLPSLEPPSDQLPTIEPPAIQLLSSELPSSRPTSDQPLSNRPLSNQPPSQAPLFRLSDILRKRREQVEAARKQAAKEMETKLATMPPGEREAAEMELNTQKAADEERERKLLRMVVRRESKVRSLH